MIRSSCETRNRSGRHQQQILRCENIVHARNEVCMALAQLGNFHGCNPRAPLQPFAKRRFKEAKVTCVNARCLPRLNRCVNLEGLIPPLYVDFDRAQSEDLQVEDCGAQTGNNLRLAVVEKAFIRNRKTCEDLGWSRIRWFEEAS